LEEEVESSMVMKRLRLSDDNSSDSPKEETEEDEEDEEMDEEVSSEESSMNQLDTSKEKFLEKRGRDIIVGDDGDTTSLSSEPHTPEMSSSHMRSNPDSSNDGDR
jgi:hypothetical protein